MRRAPNNMLSLATNGSQFTDSALDKLLTIKNMKEFHFSVYAIKPETYKKIIGLSPDTLNKFDNAAERLKKERPDIKITVGVAPCYLTKDEYILFLQHWQKKDVTVVPHIIIYNSINTNNDLIDSRCKIPCPDLFNTSIILHNGDVAMATII
jgi:uncharacterized Fe-S cluster-containing radical SAM superfamily protein